MASATPRLPDEDSISTESGVRTPSRSAASTISVAALSLIEPAKLKPSHLRYSGASTIDRRATYRSSSLKACGTEMTVTTVSSGVAAHGAARGNRDYGEVGKSAHSDRGGGCATDTRAGLRGQESPHRAGSGPWASPHARPAVPTA